MMCVDGFCDGLMQMEFLAADDVYAGRDATVGVGAWRDFEDADGLSTDGVDADGGTVGALYDYVAAIWVYPHA